MLWQKIRELSLNHKIYFYIYTKLADHFIHLIEHQ